MRRCENCVHARCLIAPAPNMSDVWECKVRNGYIPLHPVLRALTCRAYENRYKLRGRGEQTKTERHSV